MIIYSIVYNFLAHSYVILIGPKMEMANLRNLYAKFHSHTMQP